MDFVSVRVITHDVGRLATFWEQVTGLPATRPVPVFAELKTPAGTIAIGAPATVAMLGAAAPVPGQNRSVFIELRVDDVDATWERVKGLVPGPSPSSCRTRPACRGATARSSCPTPTADWSTSSPPSPRRPRQSTAPDSSLRRYRPPRAAPTGAAAASQRTRPHACASHHLQPQTTSGERTSPPSCRLP